MGLVGVGIMGTFYVTAMKKNIDSIYFGSLVPVTELNEILQTYNNGLANTVYKASRGELSSSEIASNLDDSLTFINKKWKSYISHYKTEDEMEYVDYTSLEIKETNKYFLQILFAAENNRDMSKLSINTLEKKVEYIHKILQKLIKIHFLLLLYIIKLDITQNVKALI